MEGVSTPPLLPPHALPPRRAIKQAFYRTDVRPLWVSLLIREIAVVVGSPLGANYPNSLFCGSAFGRYRSIVWGRSSRGDWTRWREYRYLLSGVCFEGSRPHIIWVFCMNGPLPTSWLFAKYCWLLHLPLSSEIAVKTVFATLSLWHLSPHIQVFISLTFQI